MSTLEAVPASLNGKHIASHRASLREGICGSRVATLDHGGRGSASPGVPDDIYGSVLRGIFSIFLGNHPAATMPRYADRRGAEADNHPEALYLTAAALLGARRLARAAEVLRRLESVAAQRSDHQRWKGRSEFLWALHAEQAADVRGVLAHCATAAELIAAVPPSTPGLVTDHEHDDLLRDLDSMVAAQLGQLAARAHLALGQLQPVQDALKTPDGPPAGVSTCHSVPLAMLACRQGQLDDALQLATQALQGAATESELIEAHQVVAEVFFERNQLDAAREQLEDAFRFCCRASTTQPLWAVELQLSRLSIAQGRPTEALPRIQHLRQVRDGGFLTQPLAGRLTELEIDCHLELGDIEGALMIGRGGPASEITAETLARVDLYSGRPDRAVARLSTGKAADLAAQIRRLILLACAESQQGRSQRAHDTTRRALAAAHPEGYVRPFLERARQILPLLRGLREYSADPYLAHVLREAERCAPEDPARESGVLEPLTKRERQVLQYLPSHLTLGQIGSRMCLTTNTIKTHVKAVYRKIGADSRDDAVTIARAHGLV